MKEIENSDGNKYRGNMKIIMLIGPDKCGKTTVVRKACKALNRYAKKPLTNIPCSQLKCGTVNVYVTPRREAETRSRDAKHRVSTATGDDNIDNQCRASRLIDENNESSWHKDTKNDIQANS